MKNLEFKKSNGTKNFLNSKFLIHNSLTVLLCSAVSHYARVAELADAQGLGPCVR